MIPRKLSQSLIENATQYPVISLTGPRQSGKTTLVKALFKQHEYISLEDPEYRDLAIEDPRGFLNQFDHGVILDEVQRTPNLFSYIQTITDKKDQPGQFILTGSQNFLLLKNIQQSLAGRCAIHHLLPFSMDELYNYTPLDFSEIGSTMPVREHKIEKNFTDVLFSGFYPRIHDKKIAPQNWLKNYYQSYLERDIGDIVKIGDMNAYRRFVLLCAGRNGQLLNLSSIANDCGITHTTARRCISVLEISFLVILLQPHFQNFNKRMVKSPKLYFLDTGLLCYLLRIRSAKALFMHSVRGAVFESFVISELYKRYLHHGIEPDFYFWRNSAGHEIDVVIDLGNRQIPIEIKSGATISKDYFKGINYWKKLTGNQNIQSAIVYAGDRNMDVKGVKIYNWYHF